MNTFPANNDMLGSCSPKWVEWVIAYEIRSIIDQFHINIYSREFLSGRIFSQLSVIL
jgi:hypothetical protein